MRYSLYVAWAAAVLSICILTTLASFPDLPDEDRQSEPKIIAGTERLRTIKIQRLRCNPLKSSCHLSRQKQQHKVPA
ncbi:MAG: hypothetical protein OJF47_003652 [Nitrospira sp.]|jgi:hypothetical protein|nr:MAG: hypothetical protein OJF47_003652 [Nitrospira sp.]